jgi:hypothetical protein
MEIADPSNSTTRVDKDRTFGLADLGCRKHSAHLAIFRIMSPRLCSMKQWFLNPGGLLSL